MVKVPEEDYFLVELPEVGVLRGEGKLFYRYELSCGCGGWDWDGSGCAVMGWGGLR